MNVVPIGYRNIAEVPITLASPTGEDRSNANNSLPGVNEPIGPGGDGNQGAQGYQGIGSQGSQGNQGNQGPGIGSQGYQGYQGYQGNQGNQGYQGNTGLPTPVVVNIKIDGNTTDLTTGDDKFIYTVPTDYNGLHVIATHAYLTTASSSGLPNIQVRNGATDILTTPITIDATELTSYTALTQPVIDGAQSGVATGTQLAIDVDGAGTGAQGFGVILTIG